MVLESILFLKYPRTSGVSMAHLLVFSKWANALMEMMLTLDLIKTMSADYLTTQCIIVLEMSSHMENQ
jgi:hypothetical protein